MSGRRISIVAQVCLALVAAGARGADASPAPPQAATWAEFDAVVANAYATLTNAADRRPPGCLPLVVHAGYCTFAADNEIAAALDRLTSTEQFGVRAWQVSVRETQTPRSWLYAGAQGACFRTNDNPAAYDRRQSVRDAYGHDAPAYLTDINRDQWYADRDRSQVRLVFTLVAANDWPLLAAARDAVPTAGAAAGTAPPCLPADTSRLALAGIETATAGHDLRLWIYAPVAGMPVDVLSRPTLAAAATNAWNLLGTAKMAATLDFWDTEASVASAFFCAARGDVDSDGDGIPDGRETLVLGTDAARADSDDDGVNDFDELYVNETDPWNPDATPPTIAIDTPANGERKVLLP